MKNLFSIVFTACAMLAMTGARAGEISDVGANAYWGANAHNSGDVIGNSTYDIDGATITRVGNVLTVTIATNFAGNAGLMASSTWNGKGIGYGDVFLSQFWNPKGSDAHHASDNAANGTKWSYGMSLDDRWNDNGGSFKLYKLNGDDNADDINTSEYYMKCGYSGVNCDYRNGQATSVKTNSSSALFTGLTGSWKVTNHQIQFILNVSNTELMNFSAFAMHWGETCQNDVVEGITRVVSTPGSLPLLALGLGAMLMLRRRQVGGQAGILA